MKKSTMFISAAASAFLFGTGVAWAQDWDWAPEHEHGFYERYSREPERAPPPGFSVTLRGGIPEGVEIYDAPPDYDYAPVKKYRYMRVEKRVVVIDPRTRRVVRIIEK